MAYLGEFEQMILFALVELGENAYGVAIRETIELRTGRVVSAGSIYTALGRLSERDLVSSTVSKPVEGKVGRPRKYYSLRPEGAKALQSSFTTMQAMSGGLVDKLAALAGN